MNCLNFMDVLFAIETYYRSGRRRRKSIFYRLRTIESLANDSAVSKRNQGRLSVVREDGESIKISSDYYLYNAECGVALLLRRVKNSCIAKQSLRIF